MFRPAVFSDAPFIVDLLAEFYAKQGHIYGIPFDQRSTVRLVIRVLKQGICLVGKSSVAGAMLVPFPYNDRFKVAHVSFWYFRSAREIRIFERLMALCREAGATHLKATSHGAITKHYAKLGLTFCEGAHLVAL